MKDFFIYTKSFFSLLVPVGFVLTGLLFPPLANTEEDNKFHFCFFELDNKKASENLKAKIDKTANKQCKANQTLSNTVIHCYQSEMIKQEDGTLARETSLQAYERMIDKMIKSGQKCDGLVFSGHHTGAWYGKTGNLWLKDMEALSCKEEYRDWFNNIKALWLDGCNTVTDEFIQASSIVKTPDSETVRVLGKEIKDKTQLRKSNISVYQQSYSASLDENTALSSRYLRMFPNTQVYGFNAAAPALKEEDGKDQIGQQSFIYNHLTNLGSALRAEKEGANTAKDFKRGLKALFSDLCDEEKIEAWESATKGQTKTKAIENQDYKRAYKLGCDLILAKQVLDNPHSTEAQKALAQQIIQNNKEAKSILNDSSSTSTQKSLAKKTIQNNAEALKLANKILNSPHSEKAVELAKLSLVNTLKTISESDQGIQEIKYKYSHLLFNNLYDTWETAKKYQTKDSDFFKQVKSEFKKDSFTKTFEQRIQSPYTASLRKGDYIKFYTELHDIDISTSSAKAVIQENCFNDNENKESCIKGHLVKLLEKAENNFPNLHSPKQRQLDPDTKRALSVSVVDQLFQYQLLTEEQIDRLLTNTILFPENTKSPFILNVQTNLEFSGKKPADILQAVKEDKDHSLKKRSKIDVGAKIFLQQGDTANLSQLADLINMKKTGGDKYAFFIALHNHLSGRSNERKVDILSEFNHNGENLETLVLFYVYDNLDPETRQQFYNKINEE